MDVDESLLTEEEGSPPHPHTAPSSQPAVSAVAQQEAPARKPRAPRPPWGNVKHPGLATVYLPHRALLHQQIRPSRVQLHPAEDQASTACGPFGWKELFEEIQRKAGLQRELSAMVARIIRQVDQTPPYKVQAKWAPLHYIDACWKGSALQLDPPPAGIENSANPSLQRGSSEKETAPGPQADEVANVVNRDEKAVGFSLAKALRREAALLHELKQVLRTRPMDDVDVYRLATPAGQVREYVQAYLYEVLPYRKIFGDNYNWKIFCRGLHDYLALGRADEISLLHVIAGTRFDAIPWLKQTDAERSQLFYAGFVLWIYQRLVNPLVNRLFYVTLTDFRRNEYVFYRREIWTDLVHAAVRERIDKQLWTVMLNQSKEEEDLLLSRSVVYRPRFLAKPNGIRPIMVCDPHPAAEEGKFLSLKTVRLVADFLAGRYSAKGCACQSDKDIQAAWQELRAERLQKQDTRPLLFLAFDISRAYENVKSSVIQGFLDQLSGLCERDGIRGVLLYDLFRARAAAGERRKPSARFRLIVPGEPIDEGFRHVKPQMMPVERAFRAVDQLMKPAIFKFKGKWYQFNSGVAQGAPASAWLLNVYLSALERETGFRAREDEMLVRFFDDVLFVTPCPERLQSFARTYAILYAKHGLKVAPRKTQTNFVTSDCREAPSLLHGGCTQEGQSVMSWYGWLWDLAGMGVSVDIGRFAALGVSYTVPVLETYCARVRTALVASVRGKFCSVMLDLASCPRAGVVQNIYHLFLLAGVRMLAYWQRMQRIARSRRQVRVLLEEVGRALIQSVVKQLVPQAAMGGLLEFRVEGLAWIAFAQVLGSDVSGTVLSRGCKRAIRGGCASRLKQMPVYDAVDTWGIRELAEDPPRKWPEEFARVTGIVFGRG
ncbi:telomerase reverse transcriptase-like isoform X2 [Paramacrobiotus metropolitanus]|uniref:telomerase reverse transcriptase-like isoform X2 n=1 Tax=Paramacrobiotus metropolitanus TaxID=2943436 RepID=UPI00244659B9|nr:telomerase reverse transcriptase-like isoform X2 [Paramacrobiotus metropolitanus]